MWTTQMQVDSWVNIGGDTAPDHWIRLSHIAQIHGIKGRGNAMVVTLNGEEDQIVP